MASGTVPHLISVAKYNKYALRGVLGFDAKGGHITAMYPGYVECAHNDFMHEFAFRVLCPRCQSTDNDKWS